MNALRRTAAAIVASALWAGGLAAQEEGPGLAPPAARRQEGLVFTAPPGWQSAPARAGEQGRWLLPAREGAPPGPRLAVTLVRLEGEKPVATHVARWARGWQRPDRTPLDPAQLEARPLELEGVPCQVLELQGTCALPPYPGAEEWEPRSGWAGLRAVLNGPDGQWTVSLDGPAAEVVAARAQWLTFVRSAKRGLIEVPSAEEPPAEPPAPRKE